MPIDTIQNPAGKILSTDLVSRQLGHGKEPLRLKLGYRQEASLVQMISKLAYDAEVIPAPYTFSMPGADIVKSFNQSVLGISTAIPCALINIEDTEESKMGHTRSTFNPSSANHTIDLAIRLVPLFGVDKITILTSYAAEKTLLEKIITSIPELKGMQVATVKNYLSSQNDIIIYDHARTKGLGFTKFSKHWRVIITRARYGLFLLMNRTALESMLSDCILLFKLVTFLDLSQLSCD